MPLNVCKWPRKAGSPCHKIKVNGSTLWYILSKKISPILNFAIVTGHSCTDVTVYSICNHGNPEIGIYNLIGDDSNGYSKYQSASNPTYQVCYDIQSKASTKITSEIKI